MSLFVKICGLRDVRDVNAAVAAGANAVGFVFAASPRRVHPGEARAIATDVPRGVRRVAVMLHPSNAEWLEVLDEFQPDVLQTDAGDFEDLDVPDHVERWPVFREGGRGPRAARTYVYEGRNSGTGKTVDWQGARKQAAHGNMILAGGLAPANVAEAVAIVRPWGVDVSSGVESSPGKKDTQLIRDFIRAARAAETKQ